LVITNALSDKKALDIVILNMKKMSSVCDYFVIATGTSTTHVRALSDSIIARLKQKGQSLRHIEGEREASWILLDFGDVVCHLFLEETRARYALEKLWGKTGRLKRKKKPAAKSAKSKKSKVKPKAKKKKKRSK
jgi:ribosome-associated protein